MKRNIPYHPFFFALYPILTLFSRLPGALPPKSLLRPSIIAVCIPFLIIIIGKLKGKDIEKLAFISSIAFLGFSTSGHVSRIIGKNFVSSDHLTIHLFIAILMVFILVVISYESVWLRFISLVRILILTRFLNIVSFIAIIFPITTILGVWLNLRIYNREIWLDFVSLNINEKNLVSDSYPDIYYIILDGYGREDVLKSVYSYNNDSFMNFLKERGFYIATESRSNYIQSFLSLASSLNMNYLQFAELELGNDSQYTLPFRGLIQNSRARTILERAGYQIVATGSDFPFTDVRNADRYYSPYASSITELERYFLGTTSFELIYGYDWVFTDFLLNKIPLPSYQTRQNYILYALEALKNSTDLDSPKFVFSHIIIPHPPFVFDSNGNRLFPEDPFSPADGEAYQGSAEDYQNNYLMQMNFINNEMVKVINALLKNSTQPPIIVIQADHGPGSLFYRDLIEGSCLWERTSILNVYYFPGGKTDLLYDTVTPVNTFRIIFNEFYNGNYDLLEDLTFFSPISKPYDFSDITTRIETSCNNAQ